VRAEYVMSAPADSLAYEDAVERGILLENSLFNLCGV